MADPSVNTLHGPAHAGTADPTAREIQWILHALQRSVRAHQLYEGQSPVLDRFVEALRERLLGVWEEIDRVTLVVDEHEIRWEEQPLYHSEERSESLAFLFYKDGIREVTLLPGIEADIRRFVEVLARVHRAHAEEDDLITLLWETDLPCLQYRYVDHLAEGVELPSKSGEPPAPVDTEAVRGELQAPEVSGISAEDFEEALYFLDEAELRQLTAEVRRETERELWTDVCSALFDRLDDGHPERQEKIVRILRDVLPLLLGAGRLRTAAVVLREIASFRGRDEAAPDRVHELVEALFDALRQPGAVSQLVQVVEDDPAAVSAEDLSELLSFYPPEALPALFQAAETAVRPELKRALSSAVERLASSNQQHVVSLLSSPEPQVAAGAAAWVGRLGIGSAAAAVARLLERPEASVRLAAVAALQALRTQVAAGALLGRLEDADRDVRIAAARALAALRYTPAKERLSALIASKRLREADLTERIAFFEAYGAVAGAQGVSALNQILNGRNWLGRREGPELRACAALGLAQIRTADAQKALTAAAAETDPVVRSAVTRALRGGAA